MIVANKLSARVVVMGKGCNVGIYCGPNLIGTGVLGGKWNEVQALREFVRLPHRFKPSKGLTAAQLVAFGRLAA
jgi:hypothetical protein